MERMAERRTELLKRLKENPPEKWDETMATFAIEKGISEKTVGEYYALLKRAKLV
jgi:hypothetical protein